RPAMKKRNSSQQGQKRTVKGKRSQESVTIGIDLGDKTSRYCMLSEHGEILREGQVATAKAGILEAFGSLGRVRIAIEVGSHSPWVSRLLRGLGHELIVANPRQVKLITESSRKDDRLANAHVDHRPRVLYAYRYPPLRAEDSARSVRVWRLFSPC